MTLGRLRPLPVIKMIFRQIESKDISELLKVRVSTRENTMTMEALADVGITPESTIEALSVNVAGWLCEFLETS